MKKFLLSLAIVVMATACTVQDNAFETFSKQFGQSAAFATVTLSNREVLLVSHEVFTGDEAEALQAIATSIFALDADGKIVSLGSIRSQGTLYPVSVLDGKLMVAGHQFVSIYEIRGDEPELVLASHSEGDCESPELKALFETFEQGEAVKFQKK
ncbi:MAG: hypothetical protein HUK02_10475 [Bacteroidaceae bacterium]|nr:hypothetical protein [Bacteroidaceae bacterium]